MLIFINYIKCHNIGLWIFLWPLPPSPSFSQPPPPPPLPPPPTTISAMGILWVTRRPPVSRSKESSKPLVQRTLLVTFFYHSDIKQLIKSATKVHHQDKVKQISEEVSCTRTWYKMARRVMKVLLALATAASLVQSSVGIRWLWVNQKRQLFLVNCSESLALQSLLVTRTHHWHLDKCHCKQ